jgi:Sec-independent protein translocase protein TatA
MSVFFDRTRVGWLVVLFALVMLLLFAPEALAAGNDVGRNLGDLLKRYAAQIYGGILAIFSLVFLINRRYSDLAMFLLAAVIVAWLVFSSNQVADAARGIGRQVLG